MQRTQPGKRAAFYARYSSDLQKDRSIDDQLALCREFAARGGYLAGPVYEDRALTSASLFGRDGIMQLVADAKTKAFDVVIVESLDRISRDQEDLAGVFKRLSFSGVDIIAVHDGIADAMQIGIRGLLGSIFLTDLKHKVRRGMAGVVSDGRLAGGLCYGYDPIPGRPGERTINEEQASIIRRIFEEYDAGETPRAIAIRLNREGVTPPRGAQWNASTINGNKTRSYGILQNDIYNGKIVWNRVSMVRDPDTGKRVSRANPESDWKTAEAPHLAIVPPDLFQRVQERKAGASIPHPRHVIKPKRVLSGLLRCRFCGGSLVSKGNTDGVPRIRCAAFNDSGTCDNNISYRLDRIEGQVVEEIVRVYQSPAAAQQHIDHYIATRRGEIDQATRNAGKIEGRLARAAAEQEKLISLYVDGTLPFERVEGRLKELEAERTRLEADAAKARMEVPIVEVHPATIRSYGQKLARILQLIEDGGSLQDPEMMETVRKSIHSVIVGHDEDPEKGYSLDIVLYLDEMMARPESRGGLVVAGERSDRSPPALRMIREGRELLTLRRIWV